MDTINNKEVIRLKILGVLAGLLAVLLTTGGCAQRTPLRVALFPYIPDAHADSFDSLERYIEEEFERANPGLDLQLRPINPSEEEFYDSQALTRWLTGSNLYDVVEIDTLLLGDLVQNNAIEPWPPLKKEDWFPVAEHSVTINRQIYGYPHLLCGHFVFSRSEQIAKAGTVEQLTQAVRSIDNQKRDLAANLAGSWNLPALYVDAWQDTWPGRSAGNALGKIEPSSLSGFGKFVELGLFAGTNACLNGGFDYPNENLPADMFAREEADMMMGYSERLHRILKSGASADKIFVSSAPLGNGNKPILFADALVIRRGASKTVLKAAERFAEFLNSPEVQLRYLMSMETNAAATPRYLLPATKSAYAVSQIRNDRFYEIFRQTTEKAVPYPNAGFPAVRKSMQQELKKELQR